MVFPVCDVMQEMLRLVSPRPVLWRVADQLGRCEVQDGSGSESGELSHADGHIRLPSSGLILAVMDGVVVEQLVDGVRKVTLQMQGGKHAWRSMWGLR